MAERNLLALADNSWVVKLLYSFQVCGLTRASLVEDIDPVPYRMSSASTFVWSTFLVAISCRS